MSGFRRKVLSSYKDNHWNTYWHAFLECGHWGLAPNVTRDGRRGFCAATTVCMKCKDGVQRDEEALAGFRARNPGMGWNGS